MMPIEENAAFTSISLRNHPNMGSRSGGVVLLRPLITDIYRQEGQPRCDATVVKELVLPYRKSGRNVVADNFFSSVELAQDLLVDGLTPVLTIRSKKTNLTTQHQ